MTFPTDYEDLVEKSHSLIESKKKYGNNFWHTDGKCLYFYPVPLSELNDLFDEYKIEWNATNITKFITKLTEFFQDYESRHSPIDRKIVKRISKENDIL